MKRFSIVIPVFNEEQALPMLFERLEKISLLRRDLEWEFLIVNDGSRDRSGSVLNQAASSDPRCGPP